MIIDAPQLEKTDTAIGNDGSVCQFTLTNKANEHLQFTLSFRQISYYLAGIQGAAKEMHRRLIANKQAGAAEMISALGAPYTVTSVVTALADGQKTNLWIEFEEGGGIGLSMSPSIANSLMTSLFSQQRDEKGH